MWPFSRRRDPRVPDLVRRIEDLEDECAHLGDRIIRLRGQVTGGIRYLRPDPGPLEEPPLEDQDLDVDQLQLQDADLEHALGAARRFGKGA